MTFGLEYINISGANNDTGHEQGEFTFTRGQTSPLNTSFTNANSGYSFASFLLGLPNNGDATIPALLPLFQADYAAVYAQDDFKLRKDLVLNLGLRWDADTPIYARHGRETDFSPTAVNAAAGNLPGALVFAGTGSGRNGNNTETWADVDYKDFAPRVGFAYSPDFWRGKTVLRGGYGIYYAPLQPADFDNPLNNFMDGLNFDELVPDPPAPPLNPA
jgi:outer membrane receptor protein involved in Fe transport